MSLAGRVVTALLMIGLGACAWMPAGDNNSLSVTETGVSATSSSEAVWLAADRPGLSAVGKDYLFVGPMTVNREGSRRGYLWFAAGTTIDRHITGADKPALESVILVVDGTPMTFDLMPWSNDRSATPYPLVIESSVSYAARVTSSQIRQLASAKELSAYVTDANGRSPIYEVVRGQARDWLIGGFAPTAVSRH